MYAGVFLRVFSLHVDVMIQAPPSDKVVVEGVKVKLSWDSERVTTVDRALPLLPCDDAVMVADAGTEQRHAAQTPRKRQCLVRRTLTRTRLCSVCSTPAGTLSSHGLLASSASSSFSRHQPPRVLLRESPRVSLREALRAVQACRCSAAHLCSCSF